MIPKYLDDGLSESLPEGFERFRRGTLRVMALVLNQPSNFNTNPPIYAEVWESARAKGLKQYVCVTAQFQVLRGQLLCRIHIRRLVSGNPHHGAAAYLASQDPFSGVREIFESDF